MAWHGVMLERLQLCRRWVGRIHFLPSEIQRLMATSQGSAAWGQISATPLSSSLFTYSQRTNGLLGWCRKSGAFYWGVDFLVMESGREVNMIQFPAGFKENTFCHLPMTTAEMVRSTKAFLMKNPFTSSFVMFSTLLMANCDRDWILSLIWWSPFRLLCWFSPLLWVIFRLSFLNQKDAGTSPRCSGTKTKTMLIQFSSLSVKSLLWLWASWSRESRRCCEELENWAHEYSVNSSQ